MSFTNDHQVINGNRYNVTAVNIGGFSAADQKPCFCVPFTFPHGIKGVAIDDLILVSDTATTGSTDTKKYTLQIKDNTNTKSTLQQLPLIHQDTFQLNNKQFQFSNLM